MKKFAIASVAVASVVGVGALGGTALSQVVTAPEAGVTEVRMAGGSSKGHRGERRAMRSMMRDLARQADTNGDRALTQEEIDAFVASKVALGDADGDGELTLDEFRVIYVDLIERQIVDAFQRQDEDGDGVISAVEIEERFGDVVERMDRNDDGVLDRSDRRRGKRGDRNRG